MKNAKTKCSHDRGGAYYQENKDEICARQKQHYEENKDEILTRQKAYNEEHKDEKNARNKRCYQENRDERIAHQGSITYCRRTPPVEHDRRYDPHAAP